jgi:hypothetical protein
MNPRALLYLIGCAALALPGCSSQANLSSLPARGGGAAPASAERAGETWPASSGPLHGETFSSTNAQVTRVRPCRAPVPVNVTFTASGTAAGPYPGTFTVKGAWTAFIDDLYIWRFNESFTITSGRHKISGTAATQGSGSGSQLPWVRCHRFGPAGTRFGITYGVPSGSGDVSMRAIKEGAFNQTLF